MDLSPYVAALRSELAVAAAAGGEEARALAERLTAPLDSAARLALLEALSAAADEITLDLAPGSVEVRLRGRDPGFVVTPPPAEPPPETARSTLGSALAGAVEAAMGVRPAAPAPPEGEDGGTARVTLRIPDHLKPRIEEAASGAGVSVNTWLVRAVSAALDPGPDRTAQRSTPDGGQSYTGWVR